MNNLQKIFTIAIFIVGAGLMLDAHHFATAIGFLIMGVGVFCYFIK